MDATTKNVVVILLVVNHILTKFLNLVPLGATFFLQNVARELHL